MQADKEVVLTADLINHSIGRFGSPVLGSGVFISGAGDKGGRLKVHDSKPKRSTWMGGFGQGQRTRSRAAFSSSTAPTSIASRMMDPL